MIIAAISGQAIIYAVLTILVVGIIFWLLHWLIDYMKLPEPFTKVANVILAIGAVIFLINALLSLVGKQFISW